jgi:hypothetical protein
LKLSYDRRALLEGDFHERQSSIPRSTSKAAGAPSVV